MKISVRPTKPEDMHIDYYSNSKLVAMNTCPRFGAVRFGEGKAFSNNARVMPLEAGVAAHDAFAAIRLMSVSKRQGFPVHAAYAGERIFGAERWGEISCHLETGEDDDQVAIRVALEALDTSGFYDDPNDKYRTMANIEESLIAYARRYPYEENPVWIEDATDPTSIVGVEHFFDVVVEIDDEFKARFIGTIDGLHMNIRGNMSVEDNKTGARLNEAWSMSWLTNHQITGYMLAATTITHLPCTEGYIRGMAIPLPRSYDLGGIVNESVTRTSSQFLEWAKWFRATVEEYRKYTTCLEAPMQTHSCNRYFRTCSLIPLCASELEHQEEMLSQMGQAPLSPSEQSLLSKEAD